MFQKCLSYYRIFQANNKPSRRTFSNWQNSPNIFGSYFSPIQNRNGNCNILFKQKQFCQRKQFCNGNNDGIYSAFPIFENANSSSNILPTIIPTQQDQPQQQYSETKEKHIENHLNLEIRLLEMDNKKQWKLALEKGKSGQKFFDMTLKKSTGQFSIFSKIRVPEDGYAFVRALDELIRELATENFEQKLNMQVQELTMNAGCQSENHLKLQNVELLGQHHTFKLELILYSNNDGMEMKNEIRFRLKSVKKINPSKSKTKIWSLPVEVLPWLRKQMAEMLAKYDGTEEIETEAPAQIPEKFFHIDSPVPPTQKDISQGHQSDQKGMWQQFVKKKPTSFQQRSKMPNKLRNSNQNGLKNHLSKPFAMQQKTNLKRPKMATKLDSTMAELEEGIRSLFDFDDEEMEKYRRIIAKRKLPSKY